jgi:hypothetical protein
MIKPLYRMEPFSQPELESCRVPVAAGVCVMGKSNWIPRIVPYGADQTAYLMVDRFASGSVYRETEVERTDLETVISDLLTGQFNDPVGVIAFNPLSIGLTTCRTKSQRKSKPVATWRELPSRSFSGTSSTGIRQRNASFRCGWPET